MTAKERVEDKKVFNWKVNAASLQLQSSEHRIRERLLTDKGHRGPVSRVELIIGD